MTLELPTKSRQMRRQLWIIKDVGRLQSIMQRRTQQLDFVFDLHRLDVY